MGKPTDYEHFADPEIAVAHVAQVSMANARSLLADRTVAGQANLSRVLSRHLHFPYPAHVARGSREWHIWCEAADTAEGIRHRSRRSAVRRKPREPADCSALRAMAEGELALLDQEGDLDPDMRSIRRCEERAARRVLARLG